MEQRVISFGPFRLVPTRRLLLEDDQPMRLGSRAFDLLTALVERAGETVGKEELIARVWPTTTVEEVNLKLQISALRRVLGDGKTGRRYIVTVPGRGYNFVAPVSRDEGGHENQGREEQSAPTSTALVTHNLPVTMTRMIGREETVAAIVTRLSRDRLVTILGPGGIGKTTVALAVAEAVLPGYDDGVWLVDLAPVTDPHLVPSALATVLGFHIHVEDLLPGLIANLRDKRVLLVLDSCEHMIEAVASLTANLLRGAAGLTILATSREPLGVAGEREYRLRPLAGPPPSSSVTAAEAMAFPAVQLFAERATAVAEDFALSDADARLAVEICHRLDGLPLAIEFAAARVDVLGLPGVAADLKHSLQVVATRRRGVVQRHRTMRGAFDWSHDLLSQPERVVLRRLAVFVGGFTLDGASMVAADNEIAASEVVDCLVNLVTKSLVTADAGGERVRYRLLETTRAYALEKLIQAGEFDATARRKARRYLELFERAEAEAETRPRDEWLADYGPRINNLRAVLDWAFSPDGDASIGVALTAAAAPLWLRLSLIEECRTRVEQALAGLGQREDRDRRREMRLLEALGAALIYTRGATPETRAAFTRVFEIADSLDDTDYRLRALWGLWVDRMNDGAVSDALRLAQQCILLASNSADPVALPIGERTMGFALHFHGDHANARCHIERMLNIYVPELRDRPIIRFSVDPWLTAQMRLAVILWLQGYPDQAMRMVESYINDALSIDHSATLCNAFAQGACPVALLTGDLDIAERWVTILLDHAERAGLRFWQRDARCFQGILLIRHGDVARGADVLRAALDESSDTMSHTRYDAFLGELGEALGRVGDVPGGLAAVDRALDRMERTGGWWYVAELLRIKGELVLLQGMPGAAAAAEDHFRQALDWARRQGALSWELRSAISLARLLRDQARSADALTRLQPVYARFTEGFDTSDLQTAKQLLDALQ